MNKTTRKEVAGVCVKMSVKPITLSANLKNTLGGIRRMVLRLRLLLVAGQWWHTPLLSSLRRQK